MDNMNQEQVMKYIEENIDSIPFKTLRFNEQELATNDKLIQMKKTLHDDPALFLSKWGRYLSQNTLTLFRVIQDNYEVDFYLDGLLYNEQNEEKVVRESPLKQKSALHTLTQNRRYEFLKRHLRHSDYFSDESIQLRDPTLYDQFIGRHIPASEKTEPFANDVTLVNRILSNIDRKFVDDHLHQQKIIEEEQMEEEEEEEEEKDESQDELFEKSTPTVITKKKAKDVDMSDAATFEAEEKKDEEEEDEEQEIDMEELMEFREEQRLELIRLLEEKFLAGKDDFDYDQVDYNEEYDDLEQQERDIQDRYFDED